MIGGKQIKYHLTKPSSKCQRGVPRPLLPRLAEYLLLKTAGAGTAVRRAVEALLNQYYRKSLCVFFDH